MAIKTVFWINTGIYTNIFKNKDWIQNVTATWSEWTECLGSCISSRSRVCSEHYDCNGVEYEEKECENVDDLCFQPLFDELPDGKLFQSELCGFGEPPVLTVVIIDFSYTQHYWFFRSSILFHAWKLKNCQNKKSTSSQWTSREE